jgi:nucleoside phosphorylase/tetratricopeptide (TPR) repeat protein
MTTILLITSKQVETRSVLDVFSVTDIQREYIRKRTYYRLGQFKDADIWLLQVEEGTATPGGSLDTIPDAIEVLHPSAIIMVGCAFGLKPEAQQTGDILVSKQLVSYEPQKRKDSEILPHGDRITCSVPLLDRFRSGELDWKGAKIHFGPLLSGEKEVSDRSFRDELLRLEPEAIGGDKEGTGLYVAASKEKTDWIIVRAISGWADDESNQEEFAARNAAQFVKYVIGLGGWELRFVGKSSRGVFTSPQVPDYQTMLGRQKEVKEIHQFIDGEKENRKTFATLYGLPGIGKSTVAAFAVGTAGHNHHLLWIDCEPYETWEEILPDFSKVIGRDMVATEDMILFLSQEPIVLVFDHADHLYLDKLLNQLQPSYPGKVILTRCKTIGYRSEYRLKILPLPRDVGIQLFLKCTGAKSASLNEAEQKDIETLCDRFTGYIPQAICWIGSAAQNKKFEVLQEELNNPHWPLASKKSVALDLIFQKVLPFFPDDRSGLMLLRRMVMLGDALSEGNIRRMAQVEPQVDDYLGILSQLCTLQLVQKIMGDNDHELYYRIPSTVQQYVLREDKSISIDARKAAAQCIFTSHHRSSWPLGLQHLFDAEEWEEIIFQAKDKFNIEENQQLFSLHDLDLLPARAHWAMAYYHQRANNFHKAIELAEYRWRLRPVKGTDNYVKTLSLILRFNNILARCYYLLGNAEIETMLADSRKLLNQLNNIERADMISEIAQYHLLQGFYESERDGGDLYTAAEYTQQAFDMFVTLADIPYQSKARANLAAIYDQISVNERAQGNTAKSAEYALKSTSISLNIIDTDSDPYIVASEYANLALTYNEREEYQLAYELAQRGIHYCRKHHEYVALLSLLLNAIDTDIARLDTVEARQKVEEVHHIQNWINDAGTHRISIYAAWAKIYCIEAHSEKHRKQKGRKLIQMHKFYEKVHKLAERGDDEDQEILSELEKSLQRLGCL